MKKSLFAFVAFMAISCTQNPFLQEWDTPYGIPPFEKIKECHYLPAIKAGIDEQNAEIKAIVENPEAATFENTIVAMDRSGQTLDKVCGVLFNVSESNVTESLNKIVEKAMPLLSEHSDNIYMNAELFARVKAVYEDPATAERSREEQMLVKDFYESFVDNGIALPAEQQERLKAINTELSSLALVFGNNLLDQSNAFKAEFGFSVANYYDKMASIEDRDLREKIFYGYSHRGNNGNGYDNKAVILRTMELRIEKAKLLGYDTPAAWILHDKMAGNPQAVDAFLAEIMDASMARAREEVADMQKVMDEDIAAGILPAGSRERHAAGRKEAHQPRLIHRGDLRAAALPHDLPAESHQSGGELQGVTADIRGESVAVHPLAVPEDVHPCAEIAQQRQRRDDENFFTFTFRR